VTPDRLSSLPPTVTGAVVTVGTFDGVHRGHQHVLTELRSRAARLQLPSIVVTFEPHPLEVVSAVGAPPRLTVREEKQLALASYGIDYVAVLPFTTGLAALSAEEFIRDVLVRRFHMRALLIGHDHGFGRGREGDADLVRRIGVRDGFPVDVVEAVSLPSGARVSSRSIRTAIETGDLEAASEGLGRPYEVVGRVTAGERRGRLLGFPTLNLELPSSRKLLPPLGVYAVRVSSGAGTFGGMMNLGPRPTFGEAVTTLEVHLFGASGDWYGRPVAVEFVKRLRDTRKFEGADALLAQLHRDAADAQHALTAYSSPGSLIGSG
jgi:riboflavin kinase / FMN adenylyltransferase